VSRLTLFDDPSGTDRRGFLRAGATTTAAALRMASEGHAAPVSATEPTMPRRLLGKTDVDVTILTLGTWMGPGRDRLPRFADAFGERCIDPADRHRSAPAIPKVDAGAVPGPQGDLPRHHGPTVHAPRIDRAARLALGEHQADFVEMLLSRGIGPDHGDESLEWPKGREWKAAVEALKRSGKARFVGFSCSDARHADDLQAAAEGDFLGEVQNALCLNRNSAANRALDARHKLGIGLIPMKQVAGQRDRAVIARRLPTLKERGLTHSQVLLHAIRSDGRISLCRASMRTPTGSVRTAWPPRAGGGP